MVRVETTKQSENSTQFVRRKAKQQPTVRLDDSVFLRSNK